MKDRNVAFAVWNIGGQVEKKITFFDKLTVIIYDEYSIMNLEM